jgi:hypothetical protein
MWRCAAQIGREFRALSGSEPIGFEETNSSGSQPLLDLEFSGRVFRGAAGLTRANIILKRRRGDRGLEKAYFDQARIALDPEDIARSVLLAPEQPAHMQIPQIFILPVNRW